jgi:hypothetical protein
VRRIANLPGAATKICVGILACFAFADAHADPAATKLPPSPQVRFFADGLEVPLGTMYEMLQYIQACSLRFPKECAAGVQRNFGDSLAQTASLLNLGSLYAAAFARVPAPSVSSAQDAAQKVQKLIGRFNREARDYDRKLMVRWGAVVTVCDKDSDDGLGKLYALYELDSRRFHGESAEQFSRSVEAIDAERTQLARLIRDQWPASTCKKAYELGRYVLRGFFQKVKPLSRDDWKPLTQKERTSLAGAHIWEMAFELAREHEPAVGIRVEAYERAHAPAPRKD